MPLGYLRQVKPSDSSHLAGMMGANVLMHRHLDWVPALDWIGKQPFYIGETPSGIQAALACPEDPPGVAWIRLFLCSLNADPNRWFTELFQKCQNHFSNNNLPLIPSLALSEWYASILEKNNFHIHQHIVTLYLDIAIPFLGHKVNSDLFIRWMEPDDLPFVAQIDRNAFEPIWQNSIDQIALSHQQSIYATVAELDGEIIGFQISTGSVFSAHLARLAVEPQWQGHGIGYHLIHDLVLFCQRQSMSELSLNTQSDNHASLSLYQKAGFKLGRERFPVFLYTK